MFVLCYSNLLAEYDAITKIMMQYFGNFHVLEKASATIQESAESTSNFASSKMEFF